MSEERVARKRLGEMLYRQTCGHPLFTIELLRGMQEGGVIQDQAGRWVEGPALDWETLPALVEAVIAERIGRLAQPLRAALRVASVEGEVFTAEVVARVRAASYRVRSSALYTQLFREKSGEEFNESNVIDYLRGLRKKECQKARRYIEKTPLQIMTRIRRIIEQELGWEHADSHG